MNRDSVLNLAKEDGCQEGILDTAEFNREYLHDEMVAGDCSCDYEHMNEDFCAVSTL